MTVPSDVAVGMTASLCGTLRLARELVNAERTVDLSGLDERVGLLCARALDLPPDEGRALRPELCRLLEIVAGLEAALIAAADPD